jgi:hypothetical protein
MAISRDNLNDVGFVSPEYWNDGISEYWVKKSGNTEGAFPLFQYSKIPFFLFQVVLRPVNL